MSIRFPNTNSAGRALVPTTLSFTPGIYPIKVYRTLSGATVKRSFGDKPAAAQLRMVFTNQTDDTANIILKHYDDTASGFERFTLSLTILRGKSEKLQERIRRLNLYRWEYAAPPEVTSVFPGISTISVDLAGEINVR